ncbi:pre-piRNA 3'-exonuclease trimmer-like [Diprion similis]|uniref:pre-piRNA 3'-exonuclease trimmer-like n=1 Tax=Diprion similis TaxID=362088 RepID=UPI001EF8B184|nr:pre-piRNA 3'-exonuclease trimmer-like [Diprion similis]
MYNVTASNFGEFSPKIRESLNRAKFVSFDCEFSGINSFEETKVSLFDTVEDRYQILKSSIKRCIAIQVGLTTYNCDRDVNKYNAEVFNFYLFPNVAPGRDTVFEWRASAIEFLCSHKFDFNKLAYDGISYLNEEEEQELRRRVADNILLRNIERSVSYMEEDKLKESYNRVAEWLKTSNVGEPMSLDAASPMLEYLMQKELRTRYPQIWTEPRHGKIILQRVDKEMRTILEEKEDNKLEETLVNSYLGFSDIFKLIVSLKKPIVGHNVLLDLMFMHQQFYMPLPDKYNTFKNNIHRLFPTIYDTKHLSFELKRLVQKKNLWESNGLATLYNYFKENRSQMLALNSPQISLCDEQSSETGRFHEAGWDSYCAGYCFIKLAHVFAISHYGGETELRPLTNAEILSGPKAHANCINLIRARISHVNLAGPDPICARPQWLHVKSLGPNKMNISQIAEMFSPYGAVDVKLLKRHQALVAVGNHGTARDILTRFRSSRDIQVAPYSLLRHSPALQILLWGGILVSGGALAWVMHRNLHKSSVS